jgi:hypothetical protein
VLARVLVRRVVAAADLPASEADAKVHPPVTRSKAFLAPLDLGGRGDLDLVEVRAANGHVEDATEAVKAAGA